MSDRALILLLGDQLALDKGALKDARPGRDAIVMAEVSDEAHYVKHSKHKIALIFSAMRHFRDDLKASGHEVHYFEYAADGPASLTAAADIALQRFPAAEVCCCEPGEQRLRDALLNWTPSVPLRIVPNDHFLCSTEAFDQWAGGRKQLRMEYFYREMRKRYGILLTADGKPEGGKWNYDAENRRGWRSQLAIPDPPIVSRDTIDEAVMALVNSAFSDNPGALAQFHYATTREGAQQHFDWFIANALPHFGTYQDAIATESPFLFHSLISAYLNIGLLDPLAVCQRVEAAYHNDECSLATAEGFIRQILGWREYVRGVYWLLMPEYAQRNALAATRPLPEWFWNADTDMHCLSAALRQTLDLGYAHHIQRLMVIGNFALLAGLDVKSVCQWYLAVYVDAFEWVELPNTLGMALHADGGVMGSKPYAASGKYIKRQGDHCKQCRYDVDKVTGEGACPYNSLYWHFIDRHAGEFAGNPRMNLTMANWKRKKPSEQRAILSWADQQLSLLAPAGVESP